MALWIWLSLLGIQKDLRILGKNTYSDTSNDDDVFRTGSAPRSFNVTFHPSWRLRCLRICRYKLLLLIS